MGIEIERKFLVADDRWRRNATGIPYRQGYLKNSRDLTVRVRTAGSTGKLTIKGEATGLLRPEFEYEIPLQDAEELLEKLCPGPLIEKTRFRVEFGGLVWEIDVFSGVNKGLVVAEIELDDENQHFDRPPWLGREVTGDPRYFNARLVLHPYREWEGDRE